MSFLFNPKQDFTSTVDSATRCESSLVWLCTKSKNNLPLGRGSNYNKGIIIYWGNRRQLELVKTYIHNKVSKPPS